MSKSRDYADLKQDLDDSAFSGSYNDLDDRPTIPSNVSQLTNDANYTANAVTSVNGETGSSVSLSLNDLDDVDTSASGTQKFLTKSGSTHLYSSVDYNNILNTPDLTGIEYVGKPQTNLTQVNSNFKVVSSSGITATINATGTNNARISFQESGSGKFSIGNNGSDDFTIYNIASSKTPFYIDADANDGQMRLNLGEFKHTTDYGYISMGPSSTFTADFNTDRFYFGFNKNVTIQGGVFCNVGNSSTVHLSTNSDDSFASQYKVVHDNADVKITNENGTLYVAGVDVATRDAALTQAESDIDALEAKTSLTDFTNDISEVTTTTPTSGAGKPVGYVWYGI